MNNRLQIRYVCDIKSRPSYAFQWLNRAAEMRRAGDYDRARAMVGVSQIWLRPVLP